MLVKTAVSCHVILCHTNNATHPVDCRQSFVFCWLQVTVHPEGLATRHLDTGFPWFYSVLQQMLSRYSKSTLHCILLSQASLTQLHNFCPNAALPTPSTFRHSDALLPSVEHSPLSTSPLLNALRCFQLTFIRRTSRHCLRIFKAVKIYVPRPVYFSSSLIFPVC